MADIVILALILLYSVFVIRGIMRKKRRGGACCSCGGSCTGCSGCSASAIDSLIRKAVEEKQNG